MNNPPVVETAEINSLKEGSSLFQSRFWASFKSFFGWKPYYFIINDKNLIVLVRSFKKIFSLCYVPFAPDQEDSEYICYIASVLKKHLPGNCIFIRFDLPWEKENTQSEEKYSKNSSQESNGFLKNNEVLNSLVKSAVDIQPPSTVILDLSPSEDEILKGMKSKTRYNIRLSERKGVTVKQYGAEALDEWYEIYKETALRDKITLHNKDYYKKLFALSEELKDSPDLRIYMAEVEGENIAGIITSFYSSTAIYLYGASKNTRRETMPAYLLQWKAMMDAKNEGCKSYDFFGIPPADDPSHPMHGLYRFKTGFGGRIVHRVGCYDYRINKFLYFVLRAAENIRNFYYKKYKKR